MNDIATDIPERLTTKRPVEASLAAHIAAQYGAQVPDGLEVQKIHPLTVEEFLERPLPPPTSHWIKRNRGKAAVVTREMIEPLADGSMTIHEAAKKLGQTYNGTLYAARKHHLISRFRARGAGQVTQTDRVCALVNGERTYAQIAEAAGVTVKQAHAAVAKGGLISKVVKVKAKLPPRRKKDAAKEARYREICDGTRTANEAADALGVTDAAVHKAIRKYGLTLKPAARGTENSYVRDLLRHEAQRRTKETEARYREVCDGTKTARQAAAILGVSQSAVWTAKSKYGLDIAPARKAAS